MEQVPSTSMVGGQQPSSQADQLINTQQQPVIAEQPQYAHQTQQPSLAQPELLAPVKPVAANPHVSAQLAQSQLPPLQPGAQPQAPPLVAGAQQPMQQPMPIQTWQAPTWTPPPQSQPHKDLPANPFIPFIRAPPQPKVVLLQGQPADQAKLITQILSKDAFNAFCVECGKNKSTHFNVTYGIFICEYCARIHWQAFTMNESYVKACFTENWDKHQLKVAQLFGNKPFFEFIRQYGIQKMTIAQKYKTIAVKYYRDRVNFTVLGGIDTAFASRPVPTVHEGALTKKQLKQRQQPQAQQQQQPMASAAPMRPGGPLIHE